MGAHPRRPARPHDARIHHRRRGDPGRSRGCGDGLEQRTGGQDQSAGPTAHGDIMNRRALWRRLRDERGQATLEAILVVPLVLVPVLFGVVTFGELEHTRLARARRGVAGRTPRAVGTRIPLNPRIGGPNPAPDWASLPPPSPPGATR